MADKLSIPLKFPFKNALGEQIKALPITRLKRKDIAAAQSHSKDDAVIEDHLLAKMTGLTLEDLNELDIADSRLLTEVFREMANGGDIAAVLGRGAAAGTQDAAQ